MYHQRQHEGAHEGHQQSHHHPELGRPQLSLETDPDPEKHPMETLQMDSIPIVGLHDNLIETQLSEDDEKMVLNVGGVRHETHVSTLCNIRATRLCHLAEQHAMGEVQKDVYFFDRHPAVFNSIIDFYRTGELHVPLEVCGAVVKRELDYWQINENHIKSCCWRTYRSYIENKRILDSFNKSILKEHVKIDLDHMRGWKLWQMKVWLVLEYPRTSKTALMYGVISFLFVVVAITGFCLETIPDLKPELRPVIGNESGCETEHSNVKYLLTPKPGLQMLDLICTVYFTIELLVRFFFAPDKLQFVISAMNIIDLLALVPLYMQLILDSDEYQFCFVNERLMIEIMFILRIIRMFRIFHLVRHYQALQILVYALKASVKELLMLGIFILIGMLLFATMVYYAERKDAVNPGDMFSTIPIGFWWSLVTMSAVGYGDIYPKTPIGYLVGAVCAVSGVLLVALTYPVISMNFTLFYTHARSRRERIPETELEAEIGLHKSRAESQHDAGVRKSSNGSLIFKNSMCDMKEDESMSSSVHQSSLTASCGPARAEMREYLQTYGIPKSVTSISDVMMKQADSN